MKILFAACTWGLGHATRDLPILKELIKRGHDITIVTSGRSLNLLKQELKDSCKYLDIPDYPLPYTKTDFFVLKFISLTPLFINAIRKEHKIVDSLLEKNKYDLIISDTRYGFNKSDIPSYFICHQLRFVAPKRIKMAEKLTEKFNNEFSDRFKKIIVPDYEKNGLSGDLSHNLKYFDKDKVEYIGFLSNINKKNLKNDIDYFVSVSGPEPQRTIFEQKVLLQLNKLKGKVVVVLGKPEFKNLKPIKKDNIIIYQYADQSLQENLMNRAKMIVSRSGYTTMMEIASINKKAFYIPTPGQTEQVYLAEYCKEQGFYHYSKQDEFDLSKDLDIAKRFNGYKVKENNAVKKFMKIIRA